MKLSFAWGKFLLTKAFINYIIALNAISTLFHVAQFLGLEWKTVKNIDKAHLKKRPKQFFFKKLRFLSIDEIAIRKGHKYMTIFTDITTGQIIYAVKGCKEEIMDHGKNWGVRLYRRISRETQLNKFLVIESLTPNSSHDPSFFAKSIK